MTIACMTCAEIEQKICDLANEIADPTSCGGLVVSEGDIKIDHLSGKKEALSAWREMFRLKCQGSGDLYEFVHVPCVKPATCVGSTCSVPSKMRQNRRRYSRSRR